MATQSKPNYFVTVEEYLKQEASSQDRHEYFNGEVFLIAGGSPAHADLASNLIQAIGPALRNSGCRVRGSDMGIRTPEGLYTYPDVVVSCKPERFEGNLLLNPVLIIEVLSESTEAYDRGAKFERYRSIDSFREYLLVAQDRMYVEHYIRQSVNDALAWSMRIIQPPSDVIAFETVPLRLFVAQLYENITFETKE